MFVIACEFSLHIHLYRHWHVRVQQAIDAPVTLDGHHDDRKLFGMLPFIGKPAQAGAAVVEDYSALSAIVTAVAAWDHDPRGMLGGEELSSLFTKSEPADEILKSLLGFHDVNRIFNRGFDIGVVAALEQRLVDRLHIAHLAE